MKKKDGREAWRNFFCKNSRKMEDAIVMALALNVPTQHIADLIVDGGGVEFAEKVAEKLTEQIDQRESKKRS